MTTARSAAREQLRLRVAGMRELVAPLTHLAVPGREQPVHRALRRQVPALVEQRRPDLRGRAVDEPLRVQLGQHGLALGLRQRPAGVGRGLAAWAPAGADDGRSSPATPPARGTPGECR